MRFFVFLALASVNLAKLGLASECMDISSSEVVISRSSDQAVLYKYGFENFSTRSAQPIHSDSFWAHGAYWQIVVYPHGADCQGYVSISLEIAETSEIWLNKNCLGPFKLKISLKNGSRCFQYAVVSKDRPQYSCPKFIPRDEVLKNALDGDTFQLACKIYPFKIVPLSKELPCRLSASSPQAEEFEDEFYPIQNASQAKGFVCIVVNIDFDEPRFPALTAYNADKERLRSMSHLILGCQDNDIEIHEGKSAVEIKELFSNLAKKDFKNYDYLMVFFLSHGYEGLIIGKDGQAVNIKTLTSFFSPKHCASLAGKPKCFLLQACRAKFSESPIEREDSPVERNFNRKDDEIDFLVSHACTEGSIAWTNTMYGSWYIQAFCQALAKMYDTHHFLDILVRANLLLSKRHKNIDTYGEVTQTAVQSHTLLRKFVLCRAKKS